MQYEYKNEICTRKFFSWKNFREFFFNFREFFFCETRFRCGLLVAHDLAMICLWSPLYLQAATVKMRKNFCTCKNFSILQKCRKNAQNAKKKCDFWAFFLIKNVFFIQQRSLKCIIIFHFLYRKCWFFHLKKRIILLIFFIQKTHIFYKSFCITKNVFFIDRNTIFKKKIAQYE